MRVVFAVVMGCLLTGAARAEVLRPQSTCGTALRIIKSRDPSSVPRKSPRDFAGSLVQFMSDAIEASDADFVKRNKLSVLKSISEKMRKKLVEEAIAACKGNEELPANWAAMASYVTLRVQLDLPGDKD